MILFKLKNRRVFALLLLILIFIGCSTTAKEKKLEKNGLTLTYHPKTTVGFDADTLKLQHPVNISEAMVRNHLVSLYFEDMSLLGKEKPVFAAEDIEKISPWLAKALNRVNPNNIVHFEIQTTKGITVAEVFGDSNKLHWRFTMVRGVDFKKNMLAGWGNTWHLVPKAGQSYYRVDKLLGKKTWENWLLADVDLPADRSKSPQKKSPAPQKPGKQSPDLAEEPVNEDKKPREDKKSPEKNPELEEKLRFLKQLQDKGLIDGDEYKRKRKALVDEYL